ncbi:cell envelope biogenesis protein TolA [Cupriavidus plantarum]|uniref:cell envelope biogenesis protein TolA n=1 Tax=Cupriavidus plantarum TaxID=942865 RepID=UPI00339D4C8C
MAAVIAERKAAPTDEEDAEREALLDDGLRAFLHKEIRVALDETGAAASRSPAQAPRPAPPGQVPAPGAGEGAGMSALLAQRLSTLEDENRQLRERAAIAEAAARGAQAETTAALAALTAERESLARKEAGLVAALQTATEELARMGERHAAAERRRALETDNVRQAYRAERDALAGRVSFLEEELKRARSAADAYRQVRGR